MIYRYVLYILIIHTHTVHVHRKNAEKNSLFSYPCRLPFQAHMLIYSVVIRIVLYPGAHPAGRLVPFWVIDKQFHRRTAGQLNASQLKASIAIPLQYTRGENRHIIVGKQLTDRSETFQRTIQFAVKLLFIRIQIVDELYLKGFDHVAILHEIFPYRAYYFTQP